MFSEDPEVQKYSVYVFWNNIYSLKSDKQLESISHNIKPESIQRLCLLLAQNTNDNQFLFTICLILINISYTMYGEELIISVESNLRYILNFINNIRGNRDMVEYAIVLIKDLTQNFPSSKKFFLDNCILTTYQSIYNTFQLDNQIIEVLITSICNLCSYSSFPDYDIYFEKIIPITYSILSSSDFYYLNMGLYILNKLSVRISLIDHIIECQIHLKIMQIYSTIETMNFNVEKNEKIKLLCIKIIGNILYGDSVHTQVMINSNIIDFLNNVLRENNLRILKTAIWSICNIANNSFGQITSLFDKDTVYYVLQIGIKIYEVMENNDYNQDKRDLLLEVLKEVCFLITSTICGSLFSMLVPFIQYKNNSIIKIICLGLEIFQNNEELVISLMDAIHKIIAIDYSMNNSNKRSYVELLFQFGVKEKIQRLIQNSNIKIQEKAESLFEILFE